MRIWNADGGEVEACGNAARCVALLLGGEARIETAGGILAASANGAAATVDMGAPRFGWDEIPLAYAMDTAAMPVGWEELQRARSRSMSAIRTSSSSSTMPTRSTSTRLGPLIEHDPLFPERVNVNVASIEDGAIRLRVWERGAGLTRACGTGACATAVAAIRRRLVDEPGRGAAARRHADASPGRRAARSG